MLMFDEYQIVLLWCRNQLKNHPARTVKIMQEPISLKHASGMAIPSQSEVNWRIMDRLGWGSKVSVENDWLTHEMVYISSGVEVFFMK